MLSVLKARKTVTHTHVQKKTQEKANLDFVPFFPFSGPGKLGKHTGLANTLSDRIRFSFKCQTWLSGWVECRTA